MDKSFEPLDIHEAAIHIEHYAREQGLSPGAMCDIFSVGMIAARVLAPHLLPNAD